MSKRAKRRAARKKLIKKAKRLYPRSNMPQKYADNITICSCDACGNPRKWRKGKDKLTIQEQKMASLTPQFQLAVIHNALLNAIEPPACGEEVW